MRNAVWTRIFVLSFLLPAIGWTTACAAHLHMYPVSGPVAAEVPPPIFPAKMSAHFSSKSGKISMTLEKGETFEGVWALGTPGPANPKAPDDLSATWDMVYGPGFFTAHVLGNWNCGLAHLTGSQGTPVTVQVCGTPETKAVAKDGKGNVYKLTVG
jgi:hypothetical protein